MWVTSAAKVVVPGILDFLQVSIHNGLGLPNLQSRKTRMVGQNHLRGKPKLCFAIRVRNMDMDARLLPRKKEETKLTVANNGWGHAVTVTNLLFSRQTSELTGGRGFIAPVRVE